MKKEKDGSAGRKERKVSGKRRSETMLWMKCEKEKNGFEERNGREKKESLG